MNRYVTLSLAFFILMLSAGDAYFKYQAIRLLPEANSSRLFFFIDFALHKNPGIAFDIPVPFFIIFPLTAVICGIFSYFLFKTYTTDSKIALASFMIILGALGNLIDRAIHHFTTDYIILFRTSAINLSDALIVIGMLIFLWYYKNTQSNERPNS